MHNADDNTYMSVQHSLNTLQHMLDAATSTQPSTQAMTAHSETVQVSRKLRGDSVDEGADERESIHCIFCLITLCVAWFVLAKVKSV